ncbi:MAG: tRNA threonylcarbamoyladenosine dehydratase [Eubacteriales bacterium]|nr:tRNA threonylcarbamoyladenosine dehydratase [Eubacteriales bacterium]
MKQTQFSRTELLYGESAERLKTARVAVFGVGGVGGYALEALARSGVGLLDIFDDDKICLTNLNRQIIATHKTIGKSKVEVAKERVLDINPEAAVNAYEMFYTKENADEVDLSVYDYVLDAVDTVTAKLELAQRCFNLGVPIISSMGAGNKIEPSLFEVTDIHKTSVCPLAKVMRYELKKRGIPSLKVVYSKEVARTPIEDGAPSCKRGCVCPPGTARKCTTRRQIPGSNAFVPATAGLIMAGEVINDLTGIRKK